jgi:hypothetical protein
VKALLADAGEERLLLELQDSLEPLSLTPDGL